MRSACAYTIQSISNHNQETLKTHSDVVLPLVFFAMHAEKTPDTEATVDIFNEVWMENSPGTEMGIRQNLPLICDTLRVGLESPSWTMKAQVKKISLSHFVRIDLNFPVESYSVFIYRSIIFSGSKLRFDDSYQAGRLDGSCPA